LDILLQVVRGFFALNCVKANLSSKYYFSCCFLCSDRMKHLQYDVLFQLCGRALIWCRISMFKHSRTHRDLAQPRSIFFWNWGLFPNPTLERGFCGCRGSSPGRLALTRRTSQLTYDQFLEMISCDNDSKYSITSTTNWCICNKVLVIWCRVVEK
jgi:hypothetical protein